MLVPMAWVLPPLFSDTINQMKPSLLKLHKFLKLEIERNFDNRAVVGGLERMLEPWQAEAQVDNLNPELVQAVLSRLRDYANLSPRSRAEALEGLWRRIQRETDEQLPALPTIKSVIADREKTRPPRPIRKEIPEPDLASPAESPAPPVPSPTPSRHQPSPTPRPAGQPAALSAPTTVLPGVGPRHAQTLTRLGLHDLGDMLYNLPRRYDDYTQLKPINRLVYGEEVTIIGSTESVTNRVLHSGRLQVVEAIVSDGTGALRVTWWNQPWIGKRLRQGTPIVLSGKVEQYLGRLTMNSPEWEPIEQQNLHTNRIVPVYPLTANITQRWLRRLMFDVVSYWAPRVADPLPNTIRQPAELLDLSTALYQAHFPTSSQDLKAARHRLAFDEIFLLQIGVLQQKQLWQNRIAREFQSPDGWIEQQCARLPFPLTRAQLCALTDVQHDLSSGHPMNRLLQGDVGSGKTVIAALAIAIIAQAGSQSAVMAPTSILAEQHYRSMLSLLAEPSLDQADPPLQPAQIRLLIGATTETEKEEIRQGLAEGSIKLIVGTHALIEDPVIFSDLQFIVVDEQHRFGVEQRALLRQKGDNPHLLVMTATPIPRSLALTIYGDLDLSVMDEMPPGRQPIETTVLYPRERERAYSFIRNQIDQGYQAFMIYPLVEETDSTTALAAVEEHARLQKEVFPNYRLGLLHGRLRPDEKDAVMADFRDGKTQILVSTSVVEVGVDIPNATVMLIEGANRFGLAQLHQFRGRVGRGQVQSYCLLIPDHPDAAENERLAAMVVTTDGFVLAELDLQQRGPGDFLGTRQAGFAELKLANLADIHLIEKARHHALQLFEIDPDLKLPEHSLLSTTLQRFWRRGEGDIS
jgi:ATP-dependent DNA helicase RecG